MPLTDGKCNQVSGSSSAMAECDSDGSGATISYYSGDSCSGNSVSSYSATYYYCNATNGGNNCYNGIDYTLSVFYDNDDCNGTATIFTDITAPNGFDNGLGVCFNYYPYYDFQIMISAIDGYTYMIYSSSGKNCTGNITAGIYLGNECVKNDTFSISYEFDESTDTDNTADTSTTSTDSDSDSDTDSDTDGDEGFKCILALVVSIVVTMTHF